MAETEIELSKFFSGSEVREFRRSEIRLADYNPRKIDDDGKRNLRRSLKKFGCVGGIVINTRTGNTVVGGHQKIALMDEYHKYPDSDYMIRAEAIDVDEKTEKTINVTLNNPNVGGYWDYDMMRTIIPDIDFKAAGLTDADLSMIGVDHMLRTDGEDSIADALSSLVTPIVNEREAEKAAKAAVKSDYDDDIPDDDALDSISDDTISSITDPFSDVKPTEEEIRQAKVDHMKEVKAQVRQQAQENAQNMDAYVVLSFTDWKAKSQFCQRFGLNPYDKFIKGELFDEMVERVDL